MHYYIFMIKKDYQFGLLFYLINRIDNLLHLIKADNKYRHRYLHHLLYHLRQMNIDQRMAVFSRYDILDIIFPAVFRITTFHITTRHPVFAVAG